MRRISRFSFLNAYKDLRLFFADRGPAELGFLVLAMVITLTLIWAFARDSRTEVAYRPNIIYVEQYDANRTDAEIVAQQKIDQVERDKIAAERARRDAERQAGFKRLDDKLKRYGF